METARPIARDEFYGPKRRIDLWRAQNCRHMLARYDDMDYPGQGRSADLPVPRRPRRRFARRTACHAPARGPALAARERSAWPLRETLKYMCDALYMRYWDRRYGDRGA